MDNLQIGSSGIVFFLAITSLWYWAVYGWKHLSVTAYAQTIRQLNIAITSALGITLSAVAIQTFFDLHAVVSGVIACTAIVVHDLLDPMRTSLIHHSKVRPAILLTLIVLGITGSFLPDWAAFVPLLASAAIFHRHLQRRRHVVSQLILDMDQLSCKNKKLYADLQLLTWTHSDEGGSQSTDDIPRKAS